MIHDPFKTCDLCGKEYKLRDVGGVLEISNRQWIAYCQDVCDKCATDILRMLKEKYPKLVIHEHDYNHS